MVDLNVKTNASLLGARIVVAAIFLWHGVPKAFDPSVGVEKFEGFGLPGFLGPIIGGVEVVGALLVLAGVLYRPALAVLTVIIVGALITVQIPAGIQAGLERDLMVFVTSLVLLAAGPGRWHLGTRSAHPTS